MQAALALPITIALAPGVAAGGATPAAFKVAFLGDQSLGKDAVAVLQLVADEEADAVVHSGDFDYEDDPAAWDSQINDVLGADFPYFASVGNHDDDAFYGPGGYQEYLAARMNRLGISWDGDLGTRSSHCYQGVFFVLTAADVFGDGDLDYAPYIRDRLAGNDSIWRISSWHKLMKAMQVGGKDDDSGWGVYRESRRGGAIIATAHEHSYARTHPLRNCQQLVVESQRNRFAIARDDPKTPEVDEGVTFVHHNGLGGKSIRDQEQCLPTTAPYGCQGEWASIYTDDQGANFGALFGTFHYEGDPCLAYFYFKDIDGTVVDQFFVESTLAACGQKACPADLNGDGTVGMADLLLLLGAWGPNPGHDADLDGDGIVGVPDLLALLAVWGPCS